MPVAVPRGRVLCSVSMVSFWSIIHVYIIAPTHHVCGNKMGTTTILHEPRLDTILMVEREIQKARSYPTKKELWQKLPRKVQYQTFNRILDYLEGSNKVLIDKGQIVWTFPSTEKLQRLLRSSVKLR